MTSLIKQFILLESKILGFLFQQFLYMVKPIQIALELGSYLTDPKKLAEKIDETALLYIKLHAYDSAIVAYEELLNQYYDTDFAEKAYVGIVRSYSLMKNYGEAKKYYDANKDKIVSANLKTKVLHYIDSIKSEDKE